MISRSRNYCLLICFMKHNSKPLQMTIWYLVSSHLGYHGHKKVRKLSCVDVKLATGPQTSKKYLLWFVRWGSKCESGEKEEPLKNPSRLVDIYNALKSQRPTDICKDESPFFLQTNHYFCEGKPGKDHWYLPRPLGKNKFGKVMQTAAEAQLDLEGQKIANHT